MQLPVEGPLQIPKGQMPLFIFEAETEWEPDLQFGSSLQ